MNTLQEINNFFRIRKGYLKDFKTFKKTGLYEHYGNLFGPLVYTEDCPYDFIAVDKNGFFYDEFYYPYESKESPKVGTIIPQNFLNQEFEIHKPHKCWKDVAEKGYHVLGKVDLEETLTNQALEEAYIPHGINPNLNMAKSIHHAYFATLADYEKPEMHSCPDYMREITSRSIPQIPKGQSIINKYVLHTTDIVKYIYDPSDQESKHGPYSFHMDFFPRCLYMFFIYLSKNTPIEGRELLVGRRDNFIDFSAEALDMSPPVQPTTNPSPFEKLPDSRVTDINTINIDNKMMVLVNTINPMLVHRVSKLRKDNEVVLLTNYLWSKDWPKID